MSETKQSWRESLLVYKDIRMLRILLLGAISGFPWVLIASSLSLWLKEEGLSRSTIGWAGLIFGVYALIILLSLVVWSVINPTENLALLITCLLYTSPSPRDKRQSRMPSSA